MQIFEKIPALNQTLNRLRSDNVKIGFVPTMGAIHNGHISLINKALEENELVVCSIYVNPKQFNNQEDLKNYPRTLKEDVELIQLTNCNILFVPSTEEIYPPEEIQSDYDFGHLDKIMEGLHRPGHFQGVGAVIQRLFEIIKPHRAYFGAKDYQQVAIIRRLTENLNLSVEIVSCPTQREPDGLAMSSRNKNLTEEARKIAPHIYRILNLSKEKANSFSIEELKQWVEKEINNTHFLKLDYFELSDAETLTPLKNWNSPGNNIACIAVFAGKIRLIDNIIL